MAEYTASYAEALYSLASGEQKAEAILNDLNCVCCAINENKDYIKLINSPDMVFEEKEKLLDDAFLNSVDKYVLSFLKLLAKNRIFNVVSDVRNEYENSYNKDNNIEKVTVVSAFELSDALKEKLKAKLDEMTKKTVMTEYKTDKSVIGGLIVRFSDSQIDASVKGRLEALKKSILMV